MILQNILVPSEDTCMEEALYYRRDEDHILFDTYFNMFSLHKWKTYTSISSFYLCMRARGDFDLIFEDDRGVLDRQSFSLPAMEEIHIRIPDSEGECIWFSIEDKVGFTMEYGWYETMEKPKRDVHIACDICTFKREAYVKHNLDILKKNHLENEDSPLYGKMDIFLVDNGRTLNPAEVETEQIHLFPNMNAGGSGGFTRGLIEINKAKEKLGLTHMIFMDDDAVLEPDSLVRTFGLLSYIKDEYAKACISGAMLRQDIPYSSHEAGSHWAGTDPWTRHPGLDLRTRENVLLNETIDEPNYAAWWYACYPLAVATMDNLPLPLFLHNDDTEYGLRNQNGFLLLNGVCVWSPGFENKRSSTLSYYDVRNAMLVNALYREDGNLSAMKKYCWKRILANTLRYRYDDAYLVLMAVEDFLKGPEYLCTLDPEAKNKEIMEHGYSMKPVEELIDDPEVLKEIEEYEEPENVSEIYDNMKKKNKWFYALTANGWLFPADNKKVYPFPMGIWPYALFRKKEIVLFDPDTHKGIKGEKSYALLKRSIGYYLQILKLLKEKYPQAQKQYRERFKYLTSYTAWKKYLKLEEE